MSLLLLLQGAQVATSDDRVFDATWEQTAAGWDATAAETIGSTATFAQVAASWSAEVLVPYTADAAWTQAAATWQAVATGPGIELPMFPALVRRLIPPELQPVAIEARFVQPVASWAATMDANDDEITLIQMGLL